MLYFNAFNLVANQPSRNAKISALKFLHEQICFHNRIPLLCWTQVLPRHGKSGGVQLPFLVCAMPNLHHRNNPYKHPVYGIPDGLFSFHAVWGQPSAETGPSFTKAVELSDCLHCLYHHHEKPAFSMYAQCFFFLHGLSVDYIVYKNKHGIVCIKVCFAVMYFYDFPQLHFQHNIYFGLR